jgi:hypothetical protein
MVEVYLYEVKSLHMLSTHKHVCRPCLVHKAAGQQQQQCMQLLHAPCSAHMCRCSQLCLHVPGVCLQVARQQALSTELLDEQQQLRTQCATLRRQADDSRTEQQGAQNEVAQARRALQQVRGLLSWCELHKYSRAEARCTFVCLRCSRLRLACCSA